MANPSHLRYVIVNADDFGLSEGVNRGIVKAFHAGTISSATIMVNMPGFRDAVQKAKANPRLGVGLHFNLTYGKPISSPSTVRSLVNKNGRFSYQITNWKPIEVRRELRAQWGALIAAGIRPTHIDSHQHVQMHQQVYRVITRFARYHNVPLRRVFYPPLRRNHPLTTAHFISRIYFSKGALYRLLGDLRQLPSGVTEIHCHPGFVDSVLPRLSTWCKERERELWVWTHPRVIQALHAPHIRLIHFGNLKSRTIRRRYNDHKGFMKDS